MTNRRSDEGRHEEIGGLMSRGRMEDGKMGDETIGLMVVMMGMLGWMLVCWADSDDGMDGSDVISWSLGLESIGLAV